MNLLVTIKHVVDPIVLECVRIGVKAFRLRDNLYLFIVVRGTPIRANHSLLKVCVLEVGARVLDHRLIILPLLAIVLAPLRWSGLIYDLGTSITNLLETPLLPTSSSLRLDSVENCSTLKIGLTHALIHWISK